MPTTPRGRRWMVAQLATAALVLLAVIGGVFALGRGLPGRQANAPMLPALVIGTPVSPAPGSAVAEETLLAVTLPAALLPQGDRVAAEISHVTSPPESTGTWRAIDGVDQPGLRILFVMDGTLTLRADGPAQVVRAEGAETLGDVPTGIAVTLHTGDTWLGRNETPWEAVNPSATPAELLLWAVANLEDPTALALNRTPGTWELRNYVATPPGVTVPLAPATLRIRLVALPVKSRLAAPLNGLQSGLPVFANAEGTPVVGPSIGNLPDGRVVNIGRKPALGYVVTLESGQEREGNALATATAP